MGKTIKFISEPGTFFASSCMTLICSVIGKRVSKNKDIVSVTESRLKLYLYYNITIYPKIKRRKTTMIRENKQTSDFIKCASTVLVTHKKSDLVEEY